AVIDQCLFKLSSARTPEAKTLRLYSHCKMGKGTDSLAGSELHRWGIKTLPASSASLAQGHGVHASHLHLFTC
ncbi:uncharacterized, partial [Tachysurus ichikawai]